MNVQAPDGSVVQFPDGTDPSIINQVMAKNFAPKSDPTGPAAFNPTGGQSTTSNLLAGVGSGMEDVGVGAQQLLAHANPLGLPPEIMAKVQADIDAKAKDKASIDKPLMDTTAGKVGNIAGQAALTAPIPVGELGVLGKIGNAALKAGQQGAIAGAVQPVADSGQTVAGLVSGKDAPSYLQQKLGQIGEGAGAGIATGGALSAAGSLLKNVLPGNIAATLFNSAGGKSAASDFAKEGEDLVQRTGVQLTPGEISGSKAQIALENNTRQSIASKNPAFAADKNKVQQLNDYISNLIDNTAKQGGDPASVGQRVQGSVKNAVNTLTQDRDAQAAIDYGDIRRVSKDLVSVTPTNTAGMLQNLIDEHQGIGTPSSDAIVRFAQKQLDNVGDAPASAANNPLVQALKGAAPEQQQAMLAQIQKQDPAMAKTVANALNPQQVSPAQGNLTNMLGLRQYLSKVAGGQAKISGDPIDRKIGAQLLGTIDQDMEQAGGAVGGLYGDMLKTANARYRQSSQQIEGIKNMALGKLVGEDFTTAAADGSFNKIPGEVVMQRIQAMKPSELDASVKLLQDHDPETLQAVKRSVLETALNKAQSMAPSEGANTLAMHPNVFVNQLAKTPEDQARLRALFSPSEQGQINDALNVARRMSDKSGFNSSGTAQAGEMTALGSAGTAALLGHVTPLLALGGKMLGNRAIAQAMVNPEGRAIVQKLASLPPGSSKAAALTAQLAALTGADNAVTQQGQ